MHAHSTPLDDKVDFSKLPGYANRWMGLFFIAVSLLVISIDNTILNVALPSIATDLGASASDLQWIIDAYVLLFAALLLTFGALGDRFGRKLALQAGLVMFAAGSIVAAVADSTEVLMASRAFLGASAALIMPATLSLITATFPPHERSKAIALWSAVFGLGVGIGPVTGGWLIEQYDWNAVFLINLPIVAIALIGGQFTLANSKDEEAPKIDVLGVVLSIPGLFSLIYGIIKAGETSWTHSEVIASFIAAAVLLGTFAWWENRNPHAMLPLSFFRNMSFTGANTAVALVMFGMFGSIFFLSQYLQSVQGYSPFDTGLRVIPMALVLTVSAILSASLADRIGVKFSVALGIFTAACGLFYMSQVYEVDTAYSTIFIGMGILGMGMGIAMSPATNSVMGSVPPSKAGIGSAMNDTTRELGGAMGVAVLGTVMNHAYLEGVEATEKQLSFLPPEAVEAINSSIQGAHGVAAGLLQNGLGDAANQIVAASNNAFVDGMTEAMFVGSIIMFAAAGLVLLLLPHKVISHEEALSEQGDKSEDKNLKTASAIGD